MSNSGESANLLHPDGPESTATGRISTDRFVTLDESINAITSVLLSRASEQNTSAWDRLVDLYCPIVYFWCLREGLSPENAENVGQEVFLAIYQSLQAHAPPTFRDWLRTMCHSKIDCFRSKIRSTVSAVARQSATELIAEPLPGIDTKEVEDCKILRLSLLEGIRGEFSEQDLRVFRLIMIDERTPAEVATQVKIPRNRVYLAKSRIMYRIRAAIDEANHLSHLVERQ